MPQITKLSEITLEIDKVIREGFSGKTFWITAEISSVKKMLSKKWCFLNFSQTDENGTVLFNGVCWQTYYNTIELFESSTGTEFKNGIEITCKVRVSFYRSKNYTQLEIIEIDVAHAIGVLELEKQKTLKKLIKENVFISLLPDGRYKTKNNSIQLPTVIQRIALITAPNSDGLQDFKNTILQNKYGYKILITEYLTQVQGDIAGKLISDKLNQIETQIENYDAVVICRGGGSDSDFNVFNGYELSKKVASFTIPVLTGIGHDRNLSIVDIMGNKHFRVPHDVASFIIEKNMNFEIQMLTLKERFFNAVEDLLENTKSDLANYKQRIKNLNPDTLLKKGFAIIMHNDKIVTDAKAIKLKSEMQTILKNDIIESRVTKKFKK